MPPPTITVRACTRLSDVDPEAWNRLVGDASPFLEWSMLSAFEETDCAAPETGWQPHHLLVERDGALIAAAPMYLKGHSAGEFVFDHQWASFAQRLGIRYYPKGLHAIPFTPVTGQRLLTAQDEDRDALVGLLAGAAAEMTKASGLSGSHWLFMSEPEAMALEASGYALRCGIQYHWYNRGYARFDDWLDEFKSKRRRTMRRERKELEGGALRVEVLEGERLTPEVMRLAFRLYLTTIDKKMWGRQYLNEPFFLKIAELLRHRLILIVAYRGETPIAGSFFVHKAGRLYGRYWGCFEDVRFLHFELCYYQPVELCIQRGWELFEAGAQGHHKYKRGFEPVLTYSAHTLHHPDFDRAVRGFLKHERAAVEAEIDEMKAASPSRAVAQKST